MSDQLSLSEWPPRILAHARDPRTSHDAAAGNAGGKASNRRACLTAHRVHQETGLIDDEVSSLTGLELIEARRRCTDLRNSGLLRFTETTRTSNMGRQATVSVITRDGIEALS